MVRLLRLIPLLLVLFGLPAWSTSFIERPFPEAVQDAPIIVRGKVGMNYTNWGMGPDGSRRIYTFTEIQVEDTVKGGVPSPSSITVRELGGEKDGVGMQVSGTAEFQRGEDVVVFLAPPDTTGAYDVRGMMMGKYNVARDEDGQEILQGPGLAGDGGHLIHDDHGNKDQADASASKKWTLDSLKALVRKQDSSASRASHDASKPTKLPGESQSSNAQKNGSNQSSSSAASGLQNQSPPAGSANAETSGDETETAGSGISYWMGAIILAGLVFGLSKLTKSTKSKNR